MMEINKFEVDINAGILKINGKEFKEEPIVVTLPGPEGWSQARLFNAEKATGIPGECLELVVSFVETNNNLGGDCDARRFKNYKC